MSEEANRSEELFDPWEVHRQQMLWRNKNIDQLRAKVEAHQLLSFPNSCKDRTIRKTNLAQAVFDIYALVAAFLDSDHRYDFHTDAELQVIKHCRLAFDIVLYRSPPSRRLKDAERDYFVSMIDLIDHLAWIQTKDRGAV